MRTMLFGQLPRGWMLLYCFPEAIVDPAEAKQFHVLLVEHFNGVTFRDIPITRPVNSPAMTDEGDEHIEEIPHRPHANRLRNYRGHAKRRLSVSHFMRSTSHHGPGGPQNQPLENPLAGQLQPLLPVPRVPANIITAQTTPGLKPESRIFVGLRRPGTPMYVERSDVRCADWGSGPVTSRPPVDGPLFGDPAINITC
jgi:hypothetical protein